LLLVVFASAAPPFPIGSGQGRAAQEARRKAGAAAAVASQLKKRPASRPTTLEQRIDAILHANEARRGFWGIEVVELPGGELLYSRNADHLFLPASNMKLFTTAAAIERLGPDFVFRTTVETQTAPDDQGRVQDLFLVGRGDPNLGSRVLPYTPKAPPQNPADKVFQELADQVKARGVRQVAGALVADDGYFLWEPYSHNWAAEDLQWGYGAPVTALAFNDNTLILRVRPGGKVGERAEVRSEPISDYYQLNNRLETTAVGTEKRIFVERAPGSMQLDVWGQIPLDAGEDAETVAIAQPPQLIGELFRQALEARGIAVRGGVEVRHLSRLEAAALGNPFANLPSRFVLAEHVSPPLREDIKVTNKVSQNLHAEMLLRTLGREVGNYGSLTVGLQVLNAFAAQAGVLPGETYFSDGSGLSREDLVAPHAVVKLLTYMARSPRFGAFFDSLPVAGVDGTLAERFKGTRAQGRIHAKTGTVEHVNALSGYMDLPDGRRLAFSILGNSHPLKDMDGAATLDRIALAVYEWFARRRVGSL
jgi:D-alanyl-D-alanine carboxypeptidase/D-alanyl-D-alanine-endopeptidase (penicillin-binding protein 4)